MAYQIKLDPDDRLKLSLLSNWHSVIPWSYENSQSKHEEDRIKQRQYEEQLVAEEEQEPDEEAQQSQPVDEGPGLE